MVAHGLNGNRPSVPKGKAASMAWLLAFSVAGCGAVTVPDTAIMPQTLAGTPSLSDQGAIQTASYALGSPSRTSDQPGEAARALASVDYLAGALYSNPHWAGFPAQTKLQMLQGRDEIRQVLAIAPDASSQIVVNHLIRAADAFDGHDRAAALAALPAGVFTLGPAPTAALLANLPYLPQANVAAQAANDAIAFDCGHGGFC